MNSALKKMKETRPELLQQFLNALGEDLGMTTSEPLASFTCPNCHSKFSIVNAQTRVKAKSHTPTVERRKRQPSKPNSLFNLLVQLATRRKKTTGAINAEFTRTMAQRVKGLKPDQVREMKIKWVKDQLAKYKSSAA